MDGLTPHGRHGVMEQFAEDGNIFVPAQVIVEVGAGGTDARTGMR